MPVSGGKELNMKKFLAMMLALMMALSISAVSFGEAAEAYEYTNFEEHLNAFLNKLELQTKDLYLAAAVGEQTYNLLVGMNENGVINVMAGQNQQEIGTLQIDNEAAYLEYQGSSMALRYDTVQSFIQNLPQKLMNYARQFGIDPQQVMADVQTLAALAQKITEKIMPAFQQSQDGDIITMTMDSEAYSGLFAEAIDELLADASFQDILSRYLPLFGGQFDAEQTIAAWQSSRAQIVELVKTWKMTVTMNQSTGEMTMNGDFTMPDSSKLLLDVTAQTSDEAVNMNYVVTITGGDTDIKYEVAVNMEKTSFWLDYPTKGSEHVVLYQDGQEVMTMDMSFKLSDFGTPESFLLTMAQAGQEVVRMQYADGTFVAYVQGQEALFIQYKDGVVTIRAQGMEMTLRETEQDVDHITFELTLNQYGSTNVAYITCSILTDDSGAEYLQLDVKSGDVTGLIAQLVQTEKQAFSLIKDQEALNWITEDQLNALLDQGVAYLMQQAQQMLGSRY